MDTQHPTRRDSDTLALVLAGNVGTMTPRQATELGRLVEKHKPDLVALPQQRFPGQPLTVTFLHDDTVVAGADVAVPDVVWVIGFDGKSWPADRAMREAA
jgi:hypothetical protein